MCGSDHVPFQDMISYAKNTGGPALRTLSFHDRSRMLKALALHLREHRQALHELSMHTGATASDSRVDVDGGIGTLLVTASKGRREMPDETMYLDGDIEQLSRNGSFLGQHVCTSLQGVAVLINAYNFPVWGMLEKLGSCLLAGVPAIIKPATATGYVAEAAFRVLLESQLLPAGAIQLVSGRTGDLLDHLDDQDVISFTGSASTAAALKSKPVVQRNAVRFMSEQDSLNGSVLGADAVPGTPEFDLFIKEAVQEITTKAGQKCTAIRRILAPENQVEAVLKHVSDALSQVVVGHPALAQSQMGPLVSLAQRQDVLNTVNTLMNDCERVIGDPDTLSVHGADAIKGAFMPPTLLLCREPDTAQHVHEIEAFGPVCTVMPYRDTAHAIALLNRARGSLVASVITHNSDTAREFVLGSGAFHGRLYFNDRDSMAESTGHGSPLPHLIHGGPGRAGGSEELGGVRGILSYMQRTAIQGSPETLSRICHQWVPGAREIQTTAHPFTKSFHELQLGEVLTTAYRTVTLEDIELFAQFTGDNFYAHMDESAAKANPFFPGRVAHGYLLISFAAGLFVHPDPGPVLANTGLNALSFQRPVSPGDSIQARIIVKRKTARTADYGEVRWHVAITNQHSDTVAEYELLTMNSY